MKSVRTTVLSLAVASAASVSNLWGQSLAPLPNTTYPIYSAAYSDPTPAADDVGPIEAAPEPPHSIINAPTQEPKRYSSEPGTINESAGCAASPSYDYLNSPYEQAINSPWSDDCASALPNCCPRWFGSASGLVMGRDNSDRFWTSYQEPTNEVQILNSRDAELSWGGGVDLRFGKCFGCNNAWEVGYFGVWGMNGEASVFRADDSVGTTIDVTNSNPTIDGVAANQYFDNAREHRIRRETDFHSLELNILGNQLACGPGLGCGRVYNISWLGGFRYFRFDDEFSFGSLQGDAAAGSIDPDRTWDTDGGIHAAYIDTDVANNLYGFQIGARADYQPGEKWSLFLAPKLGIYANQIDSDASLSRGDGYVEWETSASKTDISFLMQVDAGLNYRFSDRWSAFGGYRVVAITGVALSDDQIPPYLADLPGFEEINSDGSVILHGAFAGLECRF